MRLFFAVNLAPELRAALYDAAAPLRTVAPGVRWTPPDRLHVTIKFLGEQHAESEARLIPGIDAAAARYDPIHLAVAGIGAFPDFRRSRVIWVGIERSAVLEALARDVDDVCEAVGIAREARAFHPHVTLGRARRGMATAELRALAAAASSVTVSATTRADTLDLMESVTGRALHCYVTRHRSRLGASTS